MPTLIAFQAAGELAYLPLSGEKNQHVPRWSKVASRDTVHRPGNVLFRPLLGIPCFPQIPDFNRKRPPGDFNDRGIIEVS